MNWYITKDYNGKVTLWCSDTAPEINESGYWGVTTYNLAVPLVSEALKKMMLADDENLPRASIQPINLSISKRA